MGAKSIAFPPRRLLGALAILCIAVVVFSYLLTFAIALACMGLPLWLLTNVGFGLGGLVLGGMGVMIGGTIIRSLIPRRDEFKVVGVELDLSRQPRLKGLIDEIAARIEQRTPDQVYLIADVNAFVSERGGMLGFGGRRIMGLGLPLIANLSTAEFTAVLTHEFAHYYSGDTRLGPRVFQTRMAMTRAIQNLGSDNLAIDVLGRFAIAAALYAIVVGGLVAYWKLFMRFTQLVSRQQEYRSDELACCLAGADAMADGLRSVAKINAAAPSFWATVIDPMLKAGYLPPLADGFARYYASPTIHEGATRALAEELNNPKTNAYDTHPPLKLRLERIGRISAAGGGGAERSPALALIDDLPLLEQRLLEAITRNIDVASLKPSDWDSAARKVWLPLWRRSVAEYANVLEGQTIGALPELLQDLPKMGARIPDPPGRLLTREQRMERAFSLVSMALGLRLVEQGWEIHMQPGQFFFEKGDQRIVPYDAITALRQGETSTAEWASWCSVSGLGEVNLRETLTFGVTNDRANEASA